jgi:colanic acid biosynthesis glycosyl transferase WcaI
MRLIIVNQFFYPDHSATSQLMTDLAESLVEQGFQVTAIAGRGRYNGGKKLPRREDYRGVQIERAWATCFGKRSLAGRIADYISYYLGATWKLIWVPRHDVVMALTTPPLIGLVSLLIARLRRMRAVMLVQDVYPDIAVALGALRADSTVTSFLDRLNRLALNKSDRIVVLSECMRDRLASRLDPAAASRIDVIHNWADGKVIAPALTGENPFTLEHELSGRFVLLFSGNLGLVNEFKTVLEAARILRSRPEIVFVFVGEGAQAESIRHFCRHNELDNVRFLPYQPRELLRYSLSAGDASLVTLKEGLAGLSVPSKAYGVMAAGRPILFVGDRGCELARIIEENGCGAVVSSGENERLAAIIEEWSAERATPAALGGAARSLFERRFDRQLAVAAYIKTFSNCTDRIIIDPAQECGGASPSSTQVSL